ncbi:histidine phosphatase family protein [Acidithiobacillus sp. CV18-2]|uniref:histidine phosphatase family protein n=1 Tax=Acidithiobacillus caldus TaxID=33059 RepID=UPI0019D1CA88|nr:histidine phosphatase family protein [Acidithiobacillus caldus]MBN6741171.1 histidine phosphatase family protein [Acidithiobacillus sp. MC6.1]MBU2753895.1 histidine phosphatase family protein [Acidithiobacillus sp. CV18-3]MBU2758572.1 histidine phosphatase family protein [Acidithiobacillus sp. BN09-2]MBU2776899.1 histidine phosphatase family protein [Acidithiobacillus sp. CV18-2]MBU2800057.1 histidine phosphatase family protein [Acidithiobacillus sp. VAN18-4]
MDIVSITLVRHGTTEWSAQGRHTSTTDIVLTKDGTREARHMGLLLAHGRYDAVYSSPLRRAHDTAILAGFPDAQLENDLSEWRYGEYEGKTTAEIHQDHPLWTVFRYGSAHGESPRQVIERCDRLLARWKQSGHRHILCFSHGHLLRALATRWIGADVLLAEHLNLDACSLSRLGWEHRERALALWNHLPCMERKA